MSLRFVKIGLYATVTAVVLAGCATAYRPLKGGNGFTDSQITADEFQVGFQGNGQTRAEQVQDFALLRAAQVALGHGYSYFAVLDITNTSSARPYTMRQQFHTDYPPNMGLPPPTPGGVDPYRFGYVVEYDQPAVYYRPGTLLKIKCFQGKPAKPFTYNAAALEESIKRKYKLG